MLTWALLVEMKREITSGVIFIGFIYCLNYFIKTSFILMDNDDVIDNTVNDNDNVVNDTIQMEPIDNDNTNDDTIDNTNDDNTNGNLSQLKSKKDYLLELNIKLSHIKNILQDIKNDLHKK